MGGERRSQTGSPRFEGASHHVVRVCRQPDRQGDEHRAERQDDLPDGSRARHTGTKPRRAAPSQNSEAPRTLRSAGPLMSDELEVPGPGIEPGTRGFSGLVRTHGQGRGIRWRSGGQDGAV